MNHSPIESVNPKKVLKSASVDPRAAAARLDEEPADDEAEDHETRDERLRREATSLEHLTLHDRKNPYCEFCQRGRMLKRYCKRVRQLDEDDEKLIHRPTAFGDIIEADHMFPSQEARGLSDEQSALVVRDRFSLSVMVYPQSERTEQANYESLRHFAGRYLSTKKGVLFLSDNAKRAHWCGVSPRLGSWPVSAGLLASQRQLREGSEDFEGVGQTGPCSCMFSQEALADFSGFHGEGQDLFQFVRYYVTSVTRQLQNWSRGKPDTKWQLVSLSMVRRAP